MRVRGQGRRVTLATATATAAVVAMALVGVAAHADPGGSGGWGGSSGSGGSGSSGGSAIPGQGDIDRAKAEVRDRQASADQLQASLDAADRRLHDLEASAGLAAEAYDTAVAQAVTAAGAAADAQAHAVAALDGQHQAERRLGAFAADRYRQGPDMAQALSLLHANSLHDFATRQQALANYEAAGAQAVKDTRQATRDATAARQKAEQAAREQQAAEAQAKAARDRAQAAATAEQASVAGIKAQQDTLLGQLAAARGVELGLERQRQAGLAELAARQEAARRAAAEAARVPTYAQGLTPAGAAHGLSVPPNAAGPVRTMLTYIYAQLGKPYVWGGAGPDVFDCSGLAMRGLEAAGWSFPHPAQWQYLAMHPLTYSQLRPGDLVFWAENDANPHTIYHEAISIGDDRIIQAPRPGGVVEIQSLWVNGTPSFYARP